MRLCIFCVHIETSSLWAEFVNNNRCISVRSVFEEGGSRENLLLLSTVCENIYLEAKWLKKNYQSPNLLNFHAYHLILWFFCANSSFLLRLIVKFSLVLGLFLNYNYNAFWSILLPLPFIIYLNTFVSYINYIFKYICLLHLFQYICLLHSLYIIYSLPKNDHNIVYSW